MEKPSIKEVSERTGYSLQTIRVWIQSGQCVFANAFKPQGKKNFVYVINRKAFEDYLQNKKPTSHQEHSAKSV